MKINICNAEWEVLLKDLTDKESDGLTEFNSQTIYIEKSLHPHRKAVTLTHELLHVICDYVGITEDEDLILRLEHHVYDLIKKFPEEFK